MANGLINLAMGERRLAKVPKPDEFLEAGAVGYDPAKAAIDVQTDTVAGQLEKLMAKESPLMTQARGKAAQGMGSRGLLNTAMALEAGESAALGAAMPIAQQDASTFSQQRLANQAAINQALFSGSEAANRASLANVATANERALQGLRGEQELGLVGARTAGESRLQAERAAQEAGLVGTRAEAERGLIGTRAAAESGLQAERATQSQALAQVQGEIERGLITTREQADTRLRQIQGEIESRLIGTRTQAESQLQGERSAQSQALAQVQGEIERGLITTREQADTRLRQIQGEIESRLQQERAVADRATQLEVQGLRGEQAETLARIESQYKQLMQSNDAAARFFSSTSAAIGEILKEPNITVENKQALVNKQTELLKNGMTVIGGISNLDLAGLLNFGGTTATTAPTTPATTPTPPPAPAASAATQITENPSD